MNKYIPYIVIGLLIFLLYSRETKIEYIEIPAKQGSFINRTPEPIIRYDTIQLKEKATIVKVENPVNQELLEAYNKANDSIGKLNILMDAITERNYNEVYEDNVQKITVNSKVIGRLTEQQINYLIKPSTVELKVPEKALKLFLGADLEVPLRRENIISAGVNLNAQYKNKLITIGINNNQNIRAGIAFKL